MLNKLDTYQDRSQFVSWVYKIAVRIALNEWRRLRWRDIPMGVAEKEASNDRASSQFVVSNRSPLSVAKPGDLRQRIQPLLVAELSTAERMVIFAMYFQHMPIFDEGMALAEAIGDQALQTTQKYNLMRTRVTVIWRRHRQSVNRRYWNSG